MRADAIIDPLSASNIAHHLRPSCVALDGFAVELGERREQNDLAMILSKGVASCQPQ
jgi:hypothetical protein